MFQKSTIAKPTFRAIICLRCNQIAPFDLQCLKFPRRASPPRAPLAGNRPLAHHRAWPPFTNFWIRPCDMAPAGVQVRPMPINGMDVIAKPFNEQMDWPTRSSTHSLLDLGWETAYAGEVLPKDAALHLDTWYTLIAETCTQDLSVSPNRRPQSPHHNALHVYGVYIRIFRDTEGGHFQVACYPQWFFYIPTQCQWDGTTIYVVMWAMRDTQFLVLKGEKKISTSLSRTQRGSNLGLLHYRCACYHCTIDPLVCPQIQIVS